MADAVTSQTIFDAVGSKHAIMKFTNISDGNGESSVEKVDVASFNPRISATDSVTEIDIDFDAAGCHIFHPNIKCAIASKYLYAFATTAVNADATAGRFTVELEYSVY